MNLKVSSGYFFNTTGEIVKARNGFISNSSSSSFIIGSKGVLTREKLMSFLGAKDDSLFKGIIRKMVDTIYENLGKPYWTITEYMKDKDDDDPSDFIRKLFDDGFIVYSGAFGDQDDPVETMLCETSINHDSENLVIKHKGGY